MISFLRSTCLSGDFVKIGLGSPETLHKRFGDDQTGNPHGLELLGTMEGDEFTEEELQWKFVAFHHRGKWFRLTREIEAFITENCGTLMKPEVDLDVSQIRKCPLQNSAAKSRC